MESHRIAVEGMSCEHCVARVRAALEDLDGVHVQDVRIGEVSVSVADGEAEREKILAAIRSAGYSPK